MNCCRALTVNLQKVFYNSQASVGDRQYTIILFIRIIFLPTILNNLNDREREGAPLSFSFCRILAPTNAPPHDSKILYYLNDRNEGRYYFCRILAPPMPHPLPLTPQYLTILMTEGAGITFCRILAPPNAPPLP